MADWNELGPYPRCRKAIERAWSRCLPVTAIENEWQPLKMIIQRVIPSPIKDTLLGQSAWAYPTSCSSSRTAKYNSSARRLRFSFRKLSARAR